jgi:hypothetical protein
MCQVVSLLINSINIRLRRKRQKLRTAGDDYDDTPQWDGVTNYNANAP